MKAIILAAGRGSRMKSLTDERPKCLVSLRGKALLEWQLDALRCAGVDEVGIVTGYCREKLAHYGLAEFHNKRWEETNMVSSLECASEWMEKYSCIISYSDIFYTPDAVRLLMNSPGNLGVLYDINWRDHWDNRFEDPLSDAETFRLSPNRTLAEIGGKASSMDQIEGQYMGLLKFTPAGWAEMTRIRRDIPSSRRDKMHMTGTLQLVIDAGRLEVFAVPYCGEWGEIDSENDLSFYHVRRAEP